MELPGPLVDATWLAERLGEPGLVTADVRWKPDGSAQAAYDAGHIPGSVFIDVDSDLAASPRFPGGRHPLPTPEAFAERMRELGVGDDDAVVAYDDVAGSVAARLWWMLSVTGRAAAVLDGGLDAWTGPRSIEPAARPTAVFTSRPWPQDRIADADEVACVIETEKAVVLDARAGERYRGEVEPFDKRAGHIPGAVSAPWEANLDDEARTFLAPEEIGRRFRSIGVQEGSRAIAYCGSGVTACHDVLAMEIAGLGMPRLYVGSWSEWSADADREFATGGEP